MKKSKRRRLRPPPQKTMARYRQLWRVVDGAVADAFTCHPNYLTEAGKFRSVARQSIVKRVTGAVLSYAEQSARGRSGDSPAAEKDGSRCFAARTAGCSLEPAGDAVDVSTRVPHEVEGGACSTALCAAE